MTILSQHDRRSVRQMRIHDSVVPPEIRPRRPDQEAATTCPHPPHDCTAIRHLDGAIKAVSDATGHVDS